MKVAGHSADSDPQDASHAATSGSLGRLDRSHQSRQAARVTSNRSTSSGLALAHTTRVPKPGQKTHCPLGTKASFSISRGCGGRASAAGAQPPGIAEIAPTTRSPSTVASGRDPARDTLDGRAVRRCARRGCRGLRSTKACGARAAVRRLLLAVACGGLLFRAARGRSGGGLLVVGDEDLDAAVQALVVRAAVGLQRIVLAEPGDDDVAGVDL